MVDDIASSRGLSLDAVVRIYARKEMLSDAVGDAFQLVDKECAVSCYIPSHIYRYLLYLCKLLLIYCRL